MYRNHERDRKKLHADWHGDGTGYIWNATEWRWMGPEISLRSEENDRD